MSKYKHVKCPLCGKAINELYGNESGVTVYHVEPPTQEKTIEDVQNGNYELEYIRMDFTSYGDRTEYQCPECYGIITDSEEEAAELLVSGGVI